MSKSIEVWTLELASKSPATKTHYERELERFLGRWELTPEELYEMKLSDLRSDDPRDKLRVEKMLKIQMAERKREGLSASTCRMLNKAVNSFFESNGLELRIKSKDMPKGQSVGKRMITTEEMLALWDSGGGWKLRNRAMLSFLKDSGLRIGDVVTLNLELYWEAETKLNSAGEPFKVFKPFETEKEGIIAYTHIGPESIDAIETYLNERSDKGKDMSPSSPLFLTRTARRYTAFYMSQFFQRWRNRCKLSKSISAHSLRKFHTTMLQTGGMPDTWICKLQGKSTRTSFGVYSRPEEIPGELTERYMNAYNKLRIFVKIDIDVVEELRRKNVELERDNEENEMKIADLAAQVAGLVETVKQLSEES